MKLGTLLYEIALGGMTEFKDDVNDARNEVNDSSTKIVEGFKKIGAAVATYLTVDQIVKFGKAAVDAAVEISAQTSAFEQIMGDYAETARDKMSAVADATGVVDTRLTQYMTSMTAKFSGLGYEVDDATTLASEGLLLASDAAAFWDKSLDESMSHLNSFINGSYEGGEAIGLFANDTQMAMYAVQSGVIASTKEWASLDEATKQATRLEYAKNMQKQSGVVGQAKKESEQYANVMGNLQEKWRQFQGIVGEPILENVVIPAMQKLSETVDWLTETVKNSSDKFSTFKAWLDEVGSYTSDKFKPILDDLQSAFNFLRDAIQPVLDKFGEYVNSGEFAKDTSDAVKGAVDLLTGAYEKVRDIIKETSDWMREHQGVMMALSVMIGAVTLAVLAYNSAAIVKKALDLAETVQIGLLIAADYAHAAASTVAATATTAFGAAVAFLTSPITLVILAIGALIAIGVLLYKNWDTIKEHATKFVNNVKDKFDDLKKSVSAKFDDIKNGIKDKINWARDKVKEAIDKIKGFFNFEWSLPKPSLPSFSVSGGEAPWGFMGQGSLPKVKIKWNAKGLILDEPRLVGSYGDTLLGAGEAGPEAIAPISELQKYLGKGDDEIQLSILEVLRNILEVVQDEDRLREIIINALLSGNFKIDLDDREVGRLVREYA